MGRYDKYSGVTGGFRAPLAEDYAGGEDVVGVGLDTNGRVVVGGGNTGIVGVMVKVLPANAGDIVDVMTAGEIVEFGGDAGTVYTATDADGTVADTAPAEGVIRVGHTVEGDRLIVRV